MFRSSSMWCSTCKNTFIGAGNLQMITYKFWCEYLDPVTGQIAAWYYLSSSEISHSLKLSKASAKNIFYVWAVNNYCTYIFKGSNYRFFGLLSKKHISRTAFFVISIRAIPHVPDGTFREINGHGKNRRKECQFILHFLDSPWYQQITKKNFFTNTSPIF